MENEMNTFVDVISENAKRHPNKTAIVDEFGSYTYQELDRLSNDVAAKIIGQGIGTGDIVPILMTRSKAFVAAFIGVMKSGAAFVPLDINYPKERIKSIEESVEARIAIDDEWMKGVAPSDEFINNSKPDDIAFIIFTSGSTGMPKGVVHTHKSAVAMAKAAIASCSLNPETNYSTILGCNFIGGLHDYISYLSLGVSLFIAPDNVRKDASALSTWLRDNNIDAMLCNPSFGKVLLENYELPIKYIELGSEKLFPISKSSAKIVYQYGCSEFAPPAIINTNIRLNESAPIGKPVDGVKAFIITEENKLVNNDEIGELCLVGPQMASGYWEMPELTAEKFVHCPFLPGDVKMYKTGDLARYRGDGNIELVGRRDFQIKIRGFRIEPGEIENIAVRFDGIDTVVVVAKEMGDEKQLVLYYTSNAQVDETKLKEHLSKYLADYMVPNFYVRLDKVPRNANGKIDRKALKSPLEDGEKARESEYSAPANEKEEMLCKAMAAVLGIEKVGATDDFLSLGGDSIRVMKLQNICSSLDISAKNVFKYRNAREIASHCRNRELGVSPYPLREYYPLSQNQLGVFLDWEKDKESTKYNLPQKFVFSRNVDVDSLKRAIISVTDAHPYVKTRIAVVEGQIVQRRNYDAAVHISVDELDREPQDEFFASRIRPFDLFDESLARFEIYRTPEHICLFADFHHIIMDGSSLGYFLDELKKAYEGKELRKEEYTAFDNAIYEQELMKTPSFKEAEEYFDSLTADAVVASYPESNDISVESSKGHSVFGVVPKLALQSFCADKAVSVNSFLLAALLRTLHSVIREEKLLVNIVSKGRDGFRIFNQYGMFVQTSVVVSDNKQQTVDEYLQSIHGQLVETLERDFYPYTCLVERHHLFNQIIYAFEDGIYDSGNYQFGKDPATVMSLVTSDSVAPISILVWGQDDNYKLEIVYDPKLYSRRDMNQLLQMWENACKSQLVSSNYSDIQLVSEQDKQELITCCQGVSLPYNTEETFVDMVLAQAGSQPSSTAVVDATSSISYGELAEASQRLGLWLRQQGVAEGDFVCIMLPRVKEFVVSVLAIQRIGAAYVPVDRDYPEDRRRFMIEDSGAKVVVDEETLRTALSYDIPDQPSINLSSPDGRAYMIYTSGTTGKPKGVVVSHRGIRACAAWMIPEFGLGPGKRNLNHPSFSFDASTLDLFYPLMAGATIYIASESLRTDMDAMNRYIIEQGITGMATSTAMGTCMLNQYDLGLEYIMLGGEKFLPVKKTSARLYNAYGPTEFTVVSSFHIIDQDRPGDIPIGRAVPNSSSFICDTYGNLLPQGVVGELCLSGDQLSEGYWNRPELTAEQFCERRIGDQTVRVYRTGDLARYNDNGLLEFIGRIDTQVKLRGFRIELGEIENCAARYEGISHVAAEVKSIGDTQHLCLYFVGENDIDKESLKAFLSESLTDYMVPTVFMQLDEMPVTPGGKIDRKALPVPQVCFDKEKIPTTKLERVIFDVVAKQIGTQDFGIDDNFVNLGLTSIGSMYMISNLCNIGYSVQLSALKANVTVRTLAHHIENISVSCEDTKQIELDLNHNNLTKNENDRSSLNSSKIKKVYRAVREFAAITRLHPVPIFQFFKMNSISDIANGNVLIPSRYCILEIDKSATINKKGISILGSRFHFAKSHLETRLMLRGNSCLNLCNTRIGYGADIEVFENSSLSFGNNTSSNIGLTIICQDRITIGKNVGIGRDVTIRDNNGGHFVDLPNYRNATPVEIGDGSWLCSKCTIMSGVTVGEGAVIGANSFVTHNIPAHSLASGHPAEILANDISFKS